MTGRLSNTLKNAKVALFYYGLNLIISFYSRSVFIDYLGDTVLGLNSTLLNIIGFLNLAEFGIGTAISFLLYKPIKENDRLVINDVLSVFSYLYNIVGKIILFIAVLVSFFLPYIFKDESVSVAYIYITYYVLLSSVLIGYFINYKTILLSAEQKNYVIIRYSSLVKFIKLALQVFVLKYTDGEYFFFLCIEFFFSIVYSLIINYRLTKIYPWLSCNLTIGKNMRNRYPHILNKTKQLFFHKISGFATNQMQPIFITMFENLIVVTRYMNYYLISTQVAALVMNLFNSSNAAVGNLVAEGNTKNILKVFYELYVVRFWFAGVLSFAVYETIDLFILEWLKNPDYIIDSTSKLLIVFNLFLLILRPTLDEFIAAYGLFKDTWAPMAQAFINISLSLILGLKFGLKGILLAPIVSMLLIVFIWKPYFLFREGFQKSVLDYFIVFFINYSILLVTLIFVFTLTSLFDMSYFNLKEEYGYLMILMRVFLFVCISALLFLVFSKSMRNFIMRFSLLNKFVK